MDDVEQIMKSAYEVAKNTQRGKGNYVLGVDYSLMGLYEYKGGFVTKQQLDIYELEELEDKLKELDL